MTDARRCVLSAILWTITLLAIIAIRDYRWARKYNTAIDARFRIAESAAACQVRIELLEDELARCYQYNTGGEDD
jgi:hypothetical protein